MSEDIIAVHNRTHIKFVFLRSGKSRLLVPKENQGVGVIGGRDDLAILAWSDIGPPAPKVHVYRYADPLNIITLEGKNFIYKCFLFDWNWRRSRQFHYTLEQDFPEFQSKIALNFDANETVVT